MITPYIMPGNIMPGMKEPGDRAGVRVDGSDIATFVFVTQSAADSEVVRKRRASVFQGNDMVYFVFEQRKGFGLTSSRNSELTSRIYLVMPSLRCATALATRTMVPGTGIAGTPVLPAE
jgi:hypothetical protein